MKKVLITGGAGFIGSHFVDLALENNCQVLVVDKLSYAGTRLNLKSAFASGRCEFKKTSATTNKWFR
jgi:dTDP-D-glucose 4,6-dehydratase